MQDILTLARQHAARTDPEKAKVIAERAALVPEKATEVYEAVKALSGQRVSYNGAIARLLVTLKYDTVCVIMFRMEPMPLGSRKYGDGRPIPVRKGEVVYRDTRDEIGRWVLRTSDHGIEMFPPQGARQAVKEVSDATRILAADVGPHLEV